MPISATSMTAAREVEIAFTNRSRAAACERMRSLPPRPDNAPGQGAQIKRYDAARNMIGNETKVPGSGHPRSAMGDTRPPPEQYGRSCRGRERFTREQTPLALFMTGRRRPRGIGLLYLVPTILAATVVVLHFGLIPAGRWQAGEYFMIGLYRELDVPLPWECVTRGGPKPVSDTLLCIYARALLTLNRPHIVIAPIIFWAILASAVVLGFSRRGPALRKRGVIPITVVALFPPGHPIGEMFYWSDGCMARSPPARLERCHAWRSAICCGVCWRDDYAPLSASREPPVRLDDEMSLDRIPGAAVDRQDILRAC
jgi:hypothetical protein